MTYKDKESCARCHPCITQVFCSGMGDTGCLNLQVSFRKRATNYRALLLEMTYRNKASNASSPPVQGALVIFRKFIFRKRALWLMTLLRKETCKLRHPTHLCRSV